MSRGPPWRLAQREGPLALTTRPTAREGAAGSITQPGPEGAGAIVCMGGLTQVMEAEPGGRSTILGG